MGNFYSKQVDNDVKDKDKVIQELEDKINEQNSHIILLEHERDMLKLGNPDNLKIYKNIKNHQKNHDYEYLVLSGGGVKGISYPGCFTQLINLEVTHDKNGRLKLKGLCGTSAGSIFAGLIAVGYLPAELEKIILTLPLEQFVDDDQSKITDAIDFVEKWGICPGKYFYDFLGKMIDKKTGNPDYTLEDLYNEKNIKLVLVTTNLSYERAEYLYAGHKDKAYSNIPIRTAIRMSMGIPYIFEPYYYNDCYFCDGGASDNYALHVFDGEYPGEPKALLNLCPPNPKVLGIKLITNSDKNNFQIVKKQKFNTLFEYSMSYINTFLTESERRIMTPSYWLRTIIVVTPDYPLSDFNLTLEQKEQLIAIGEHSVKEFFKP